MPWHLGALAAATAMGGGLALAGAEAAVMALVPVGATLAMTLEAVQVMKLANRTAQRRIAGGDYPGLEALMPASPEAEQSG